MTGQPDSNLEFVIEVFQRHLHLPDSGLVTTALAVDVANRLPGDPVWLLAVGPPSSGKTEVLDSLVGLPWVHAVSAFTEAGLLTGSTAKEGDAGATGGLLVHLGAQGLILAKDFTTVLNEHGSTRNRTFAVAREIYDGRFTRHLGTNGGRTFEWDGKAGFLGAVTEAIDTADLGLMGERFIYYRLPAVTPDDDFIACVVANEHAGRQRGIRAEWSSAVRDFLTGIPIPDELPPLGRDGEERLITLAGLAARCRSTVVRDSYRRDTIELVPSPERSPRLFAQLRQLHAGFTVIGTSESETWRLLAQIALDGIHRDRRRVLNVLVGTEGDLTTATVAGRLSLPTSSVRRHLEDLTALRVLDRIDDAPERWEASDWLRERWWAVR